jgi:hypothetical protein
LGAVAVVVNLKKSTSVLVPIMAFIFLSTEIAAAVDFVSLDSNLSVQAVDKVVNEAVPL